MNNSVFTEYEWRILNDVSLTSSQAAKLIYMHPSTIRYHRVKLGKRAAVRQSYGIMTTLCAAPELLSTPIKELAYKYQCSITTVKVARKTVREQIGASK